MASGLHVVRKYESTPRNSFYIFR